MNLREPLLASLEKDYEEVGAETAEGEGEEEYSTKPSVPTMNPGIPLGMLRH